ncbi:uncharacterized protein LOC121259276 [Juglans microcarpa x Juglans regia]|uniref:uncharacterized protein LOC121259276 n=1 Tax=Juglans microcarpa x Juglans regia TaxID=2249226 RepID=UPI001B7EE9B5|nr:uncharacterized protein LOC121259276 [Juglans microcarpa x Juglans regia]
MAFQGIGAFSRSLLLRFGPTAYNDPMEALTRLKQTSSVAGYMAQFETLSNRLRGLSDVHKLSCFLSGLKDELRIPIRMLRLQPYCQKTVALRRNMKLAPRFYGPFKVLQKLGSMAYHLELPPLF